jgi:type I restriction enzyme S subunit
MKHKWPMTRLGEVLKERRETPTDDDLTSGRVRIIEKISFDSGRIQFRAGGSTKTGMILVRPGDLVVSGINAAKGAIAIYDANENASVAATIHYGAYRVNLQRADVRFLWWMLRSHFFQELLLEHVPGGIKTELKAKRLLPVPVPLPPLAEQRRAVARIEELAAQIGEALTLRHQATKEATILTSKLAADLFDALKCDTKALGDVALKKTGSAYRAEDFVESDGVPVVRLKEIKTKKPTVFLRNPDEYSNVWLEVGDIILAKTSFSTGAMCQWPGPRAVLNQNAVMLRAKEGVEQPFLFMWLGQQVTRYLSDHLADPNFYPYIRESELVRWQVPVPPIREQRRIMAELDTLQAEVDSLKRLQAETATELDALLPAILDKAFKGEL